MADVNMDKLHQFVGQVLGDLGGAASVALVRIGDELGVPTPTHRFIATALKPFVNGRPRA